MTSRARLRALFSPRRQWIDDTSAACSAGGPLGPKEGVLLRSRSVYRRFDFSALAPSRRRGALDLAVRQASPQSLGRFACRWREGVAHVWMPGSLQGLTEDLQLVAESSLIPAPPADGARLVELREGFEGQVWTGGDLAASRWWPTLPSPAAWGVFLRAAGNATVAADAGAPVSLPIAADAWGSRHEAVAWSPAQLEHVGWRVVVLFVALVAGWQVAASAVWTFAEWAQDRRLESLRSESAPLIQARESAESAQQRMRSLADLVDVPSDLRLLADARRLLGAEVRLLAWSRDESRLRIELEKAGDDPRPIVRAFESHALLSRVVANPLGEGRMQLDIDLEAPAREDG